MGVIPPTSRCRKGPDSATRLQHLGCLQLPGAGGGVQRRVAGARLHGVDGGARDQQRAHRLAEGCGGGGWGGWGGGSGEKVGWVGGLEALRDSSFLELLDGTGRKRPFWMVLWRLRGLHDACLEDYLYFGNGKAGRPKPYPANLMNMILILSIGQHESFLKLL